MVIEEKDKGSVAESGNVADNGGDNWAQVAHQSRLDRSAAGEWVAPPLPRFASACLHAPQLILAKAPGNRNETNFSFSNWLLPTQSQSQANLNWTAKRLHFGGFLKFIKIHCLNLKSEGRVLATSQGAGLREPIKAAASGSSPDAKKVQKIGAR